MVKNKYKKIALITLLISSAFIFFSRWPSTGHAATNLPPLAQFDPSVWYPNVPVALEDQYNKRVYVNLSFHPYANHTPSYYDSNASDGDSEIEKQPYFEVVITKNGSEFFRCRNDWAVYDTCGGNLVYDNSPGRGASYTYSAYVERYKRHAACTDSGNDLDPDCGKAGTLTGTSPSITKTVYVGTENPPRMRSSLSYNNNQDSTGLVVPKGSEVTFSWRRGDSAGMQYAGDPAEYCVLSQVISGKKIILEASAPGSGSRVIPVGETLGKQGIQVACYNGAGEDHPGSTGGLFEVVEAIPDGHYDDAEQAGGGGAGIAIPEGNYLGDLDGNGAVDSEQEDLTNIFNSLSGTYVSMSVQGCHTTSSGFTSPNSDNLAQEKDSGFEYPFGVMSFTLNCDKTGSTSTITKHYYTTLEPDKAQLRKYNSTTGQFTAVNNASISTVTVGGRKALKVTYSVTDGGPLDEDGQANGVIVDPVGLASVGVSSEQVNQLAASGGGLFGSACNQVQGSADSALCGSSGQRELFGPNGILTTLIGIFSIVIGIAAVIMIIIGGFKYVISAGDSSNVNSAKNTILYAVIGLVIAASAQLIVRFVLFNLL